MTLRLAALNLGLRLIERPHLLRGTPRDLRRSFERRARWLFRPPRGTLTDWKRFGAISARTLDGPWSKPGRVILYLHGGGYIFGSPDTHAAMVARIAQRAGAQAILPRYRLAPEHPFPAACDDALAAWEGLVASGVAPDRIVLGGDSAGGGLALSLLGTLVEKGRPLPAGLFAFSPLTDLAFSGASVAENARSEVVLPAERVCEFQEMYLAGADPADPRASPLYADFAGAGPVWLCCGDGELLRDDTLRMAERLRGQGIDVHLDLGRGLPHVWPFFSPYLPEATRTLDSLADWLRPRWESPGEN